MLVPRGDRDLGVAYQTHPGNQASSRGEAKNSAVLLSRDGYLLEPTVCPKGIESRLKDNGGEQEGEGEMNRESSMDACTPTFVNRQPLGICCMTQRTQTMENSVEIP